MRRKGARLLLSQGRSKGLLSLLNRNNSLIPIFLYHTPPLPPTTRLHPAHIWAKVVVVVLGSVVVVVVVVAALIGALVRFNKPTRYNHP